VGLIDQDRAFSGHIVTSVEEEAVRYMQMIPLRSIKATFAKIRSDAKGYIMLRGAALLPTVE